MPKLFRLIDNDTGRVLVRHGRDAREILGSNPGRYSPADPADAKRLVPIAHPRSSEDDRDPVTAATPPASIAPPPPAPARKQPSQATTAKRNAALAKARAARKANLAAKAQPQATA